MLRPVNLRCFAEDRSAAMTDEQVRRHAQRRIGADTRITVRPAALER